MNIKKIFHLERIHKSFILFLVNKHYAGLTDPVICAKKRKLLIKLGYSIGEGTTILGPIECTGKLKIGANCWIGKNFKVNGNGSVIIGDNCDIGPEVTFQTGGHDIGSSERRAGSGLLFNQIVGEGTWIGGRETIVNNVNIGKGCVIAGSATVVKDVEDNVLVGGVPAKIIKYLDV